VFCVGCYWALMLVMFALGVASLIWMASLTALMVHEETRPAGARTLRTPSFLWPNPERVVEWSTMRFSWPSLSGSPGTASVAASANGGDSGEADGERRNGALSREREHES
jgi:hypothetical protein